MKLNGKSIACGVILPVLLTGCVGGKGLASPSGPAAGVGAAGPQVVDGTAKLGAPFSVDGVTYTPVDVADYDDVGIASWYGAQFAGRPTANGETFRPDWISAAHRTLPLPSYVEVTALDSGRTIVVRVNDRGPMVGNRLIDLSQGAAEQLGILDRPTAVRVRRVAPPESERLQLRSGGRVGERPSTPDSLLVILRQKAAALPKPTGAATPEARSPRVIAPTPVPESSVAAPRRAGDRFFVEGGATPAAARPAPAPSTPAAAPPATAQPAVYIVQVATFSSRARAEAAAKAVGGSVSGSGNVWRVRTGPFTTEADALAAQRDARGKGFAGARVMRDR